jgi:hypothetical protein
MGTSGHFLVAGPAWRNLSRVCGRTIREDGWFFIQDLFKTMLKTLVIQQQKHLAEKASLAIFAVP